MHKINIDRIMYGSLGKRMLRNKHCLGCKEIVPRSGCDGYRALYIFFDNNVNSHTLEKYYQEGEKLARGYNPDNTRVNGEIVCESLGGGVNYGYYNVIEFS